MSDVITKHLLISGRVQGVGYRAWLAATMCEMNLAGWVRNLRDGRVEALIHGPDERVQDILQRCTRGPSLARVDDVRAESSTETLLSQRKPGEDVSVLATV